MSIKSQAYNILSGNKDGKLPKVLQKLFKTLSYDNKLNIIDIGSHKGEFIELFKKHRKLNHVVMVEPIPGLAKKLEEKYGSQYSIINSVISDNEDSKEFYSNEFTETSSLLEFNLSKDISNINTTLQNKITVDSKTLDGLVSSMKFTHIDLVKIDVQGAEHLVLKGGIKALKITEYLIVELSLHPVYKDSHSFEKICKQLKEIGFVLTEIETVYRSNNDEILQLDGLFKNLNYNA